MHTQTHHDDDRRCLRMSFGLHPTTLNAAQYAVMTLVREHAPSLRVVEDLRLFVDEVVRLVAPMTQTVSVTLRIAVDPSSATGSIDLQPATVDLEPDMVAAFVDACSVSRTDDRLHVTFARTW